MWMPAGRFWEPKILLAAGCRLTSDSDAPAGMAAESAAAKAGATEHSQTGELPAEYAFESPFRTEADGEPMNLSRLMHPDSRVQPASTWTTMASRTWSSGNSAMAACNSTRTWPCLTSCRDWRRLRGS